MCRAGGDLKVGKRELKSVRIQYAMWEQLPPDIQAWFAGIMGNQKERGRAFYELYFYWYNLAHELGHVLQAAYGTAPASSFDAETTVNQFAVAYWHACHENDRLSQLGQWVREALASLEDPVPSGEDRSAYFDTHISELVKNPGAYGHYQFTMVLAVLEHPMSLLHALRTLGTPDVTEGKSVTQSPYSAVDADLPYRIVDDLREVLALYGVNLPEVQVLCAYSPMIQFVRWD